MSADFPLQPGTNPAPSRPPRPAAVLMLFDRRDDGEHLWFIRRPVRHDDPHTGQVAFPGGSFEEDDRDAIACALRESEEEIGLPSSAVRILHELPTVTTGTGFVVTPIIGRQVAPFTPVLQRDEVADLFTIPLDFLADPQNWRTEDWVRGGRTYPLIFYREWQGQVLWGASARMTHAALDALARGDFSL